jgi:protein TonB
VSEPKVEENVEAPPAPVPPVVALPPRPEIPKPAVSPKPPTPPHARPTPAATTAPPRPRAAAAGDAKAWYGEIMTRIQRSKSYPPAAQSRGEKGVVQLAFSIDREGRVVASRIAHSSGYAALDQETIATVRRAQPFPPAPHDLSGAKFDFTVPVEFNIR